MIILLILWMIAGAVSGWIGMDLIPLSTKNTITTPYIYRIASAFVGALIAYTIIAG